MITIACIVVGFPLVAGCFGWAVLGRTRHLNRAERFAASWGVSFGFLAVCQFLGFALHADQFLFSLGSIVVMLLIIAVAWARGASLQLARQAGKLETCPARSTSQGEDSGFPFLLFAFALAYFHLVCIQALLPNYRGSWWYFDWFMHYDEALVFVGEQPVETTWEGYTLASRTPLFNLTAAFVMSLAGHDFVFFQLASALTNIAFVAPVYLLLRDFFGLRAARLGMLLAPLNLWLLHNAWYTWPKMLAAYYLLLGLHFYIQSLRCRATEPERASCLFGCFGICAVLGYMTHQVSLVYVAPLLLHAAFLAWTNRNARPRRKEWTMPALATVLLILPWYGWLAATLGVDAIVHSTPTTVADDRARFRPWEIVNWMTFNIVFSVVPADIIGPFFTDWPEDIGTPTNLSQLLEGLKQIRPRVPDAVALYRGATELYFSLLTGAVTLSLLLYLVWQFWKRRPRVSLPLDSGTSNVRLTWQAIWLFVALGTLGAAFLHPGKIWWGIAHSAAFPTAIVLVTLAWGVLSQARGNVGLLVCAGMIAEFLAMFWSHWWFLTRMPEVLEYLPGNEDYKGYINGGILFCNDLLGEWQYAFLIGALVIEASLGLLLARLWQYCPSRARSTAE